MLKRKKPAGAAATQCISWRAVPDTLGTGRVRLYNADKGCPDLMPAALEGSLKDTPWVLVHLPSRRWQAWASKDGALTVLRSIGEGEIQPDSSFLPPLDKKRSRVRAAARAREIPPSKGVSEGVSEGVLQPPSPPAAVATPVPDDLSFDKAMQHVFPVSKITAQIERLLHAEEEIYDREGTVIGSKPVFSTQFSMLKTLIEYHQGRPDVKPKTKDVKAPITIQELRAKMILSDEYRIGIIDMANDCAKISAARKAQPA
jgi:hypothetical protein